MKKIYSFLLAGCCAFSLQAQDNYSGQSLAQLSLLYQQKTAKGDYQTALSVALAMAEKAKKELPAQDTAYANILYRVADANEYLGNIENAMKPLEEAAAIQKAKIAQHPDYAQTLHLLGILHRRMNNYAQAEQYYTQALAIRKQALGEQHPRYASTIYNLGQLYQDKADYTKAEQYYNQALAIRKQALGEQHPEYALNISNLGILYFVMADYKKAESHLNQALQIQKKALGEQHPDYAASLNNLAALYEHLGNYNKAADLYLQASQIQKNILGETHPDYAASLDNMGILNSKIGNYSKADGFYILAMNIRKQVSGEKSLEYAKSLENMGNLQTLLGDYAKAEQYFLQAVDIKNTVLGSQHPDYAAALSNLGILYYTLGDNAKAESFYLQAQAIERAVLGENHPDYAKSLNALGVVYHAIRDYNKAEKCYQQALSIEQKTLGESHPDYAKSLLNMGILYDEMGDSKEAEAYYNRAITTGKKSLGGQHPTYAQMLNSLANWYVKRKDYARALPLYTEALGIFKNILGEQHPSYAGGLNNLANLYLVQNQKDMAWQQVLAALQSNTGLLMSANVGQAWADSLKQSVVISFANMNGSLQLIKDLLAGAEYKNQRLLLGDLALAMLERGKNELSSDEDKLRNLEQSNQWVLQSVKAMDAGSEADKALQFAERNKTVLLLDAMSNKRAYGFGVLPDSLADQEQNLQKDYAQTKAFLGEKRSNQERDSLYRRLNTLSMSIDALQKQIKSKYPKYAALKYEHQAAQAKEIQALLGEKTALLEYLAGDSVVYIFYVDKKKVWMQPFWVDNDTLKLKTQNLHKALSGYDLLGGNPEQAYQGYAKPAHWFYQNLVAPALANAQGIDQLIIVADGDLGHLPFETFLVEAAPEQNMGYQNLHYLINDFKISYNYSATLWKENKANNSRQNNGQLLGMAANYEISGEVATAAETRRLPTDTRLRGLLNPLPAARKEVEGLADNFSGFFGFDTLATEQVFKQKAKEFAIIHLAMHGLLNRKEQALSSLAFTEDGSTQENNFLHAYEISKMELNADLVVLSACETGLGKFERGNGIASLARAFMYAGTPAMVVSLWEVNDASTGQLMQLFYNNLADGMEKDEALRQAKLSYIQSSKGAAGHPAYWSPFVQIGNTDAVKITRKSAGGWLWWAVGGGALVLVAGLAMARRKG